MCRSEGFWSKIDTLLRMQGKKGLQSRIHFEQHDITSDSNNLLFSIIESVFEICLHKKGNCEETNYKTKKSRKITKR